MRWIDAKKAPGPVVEHLGRDEISPAALERGHIVAIVAWDKTGHVYNNTRIIHSTYMYGFYDCPPEGNAPCTPGFYSLYTMKPVFNSYVDNSFTIQTEIRENPHPITAMKAYLDNAVVATSSGPTMLSQVENAQSGTHILTIQGLGYRGCVVPHSVQHQYQRPALTH